MNGRAGGPSVALETAPPPVPLAPPSPVTLSPPAKPDGGLPQALRRVRVGMPQLDASGLSEGWLLRYAGDLQWEAIARRLGVASHEIRGPGGERLYSTVVAVRARYGPSLAAVRENDVLDARIEVVPVGRACAWGRLGMSVEPAGASVPSAAARRAAGDRTLSLELLTTFALRDHAPGTSNALRMMPPAPALAASWLADVPRGSPPTIAQLARAVRRGDPLDDDFSGPVLGGAGAREGKHPLGEVVYEPSPYADYNGAGLLYFAAYVTIADTVERQLVRRLGLAHTGDSDWAVATSAVRRDVYYLENLPLGASLTAQLVSFEATAQATTSHLRLIRAEDGHRMAEVITRRRHLATAAGGTS